MKRIASLISVVLLASLLVTGCTFGTRGGLGRLIDPSDTIVTENRPVSGFSAIDIRGFGNVIVTQGATESLTVEGPDNLVELVETPVRGGTLVIEMRENVSLRTASEGLLIFTIGVTDLEAITISGAADVQIGTLQSDDLTLNVSGAGEITVQQLTATRLDAEISGLGDITVAGDVTEAEIEIPGAGSFNGFDLRIRTADVSVSGLGDADVWVTGDLAGSISGAGTVSYYGEPNTNTQTSGLGSFRAMGTK